MRSKEIVAAERAVEKAKASIVSAVKSACPIGTLVKSRVGRGYARGKVTGYGPNFSPYSSPDVVFESDSGKVFRKDYRSVEQDQ